jgi:hypothetical protein
MGPQLSAILAENPLTVNPVKIEKFYESFLIFTLSFYFFIFDFSFESWYNTPQLKKEKNRAMKTKQKKKEFKSIRFVFLKFPDSNLPVLSGAEGFRISDLVHRISSHLVKKICVSKTDKPGVTVDKLGGILDKHGGVWDKLGGISAHFGVIKIGRAHV